mmetsp:Transcript_23570/g.44830  ORF Transcript_23570/g.44830 Transcript_23570/m.44830 type:complete len:403 (-) Transcript_23570:2087-3295(-)|eukprot:scaffold2780_cov174-Amphora_coffeaeformis.AAC.9
MSNFFDRFKPKKKGSGGGFSLNLPGMKKTFQGSGQSLGGSKPGKVIDVQLDKPGSLGIKIEKRPGTNSAIVSMVVEGSQAAEAGLRRGDILCFQGSNGQEEILYDMFRELAASDQRPLCFEVRRVETKATKTGEPGPGGDGKASAEAYARKQAMIAAAEKREKAANARMKPIPKVSKSDLPALRSTADRHREEAERLARLAEQDQNYSEASIKAAAAAKEQEAKLAAELGYNPYETSRATAGQARNATVAVTHGTMQAGGDASQATPIPVTAPPPELPAAADEEAESPVSSDFAHAYETCVTSNVNSEAVKSSFAILVKLIKNAITKGQQPDEATAQKFRKVRLANAKIKTAIVDVEGALDLMMSVGFQLTEEDGESVLSFPSGFAGENWLPKGLKMMENYK